MGNSKPGGSLTKAAIDKLLETLKKLFSEGKKDEKSKQDEIAKAKEDAKRRLEEIKNVMNDYEKSRTTYGVAVVRTSDGLTEIWLSQAGVSGYIRPAIRGVGEVIIKNKITKPPANKDNRLNDAEQTLIREAKKRGVEILAIGATRDICPICQQVICANQLKSRAVTPFKTNQE